MALAASGDDALALWLEHGARYSARVAAVAAAVRSAREAALDDVRDVPAWPSTAQPPASSAEPREAWAPQPSLFLRTEGHNASVAAATEESARRERAKLRETRRKQREAIDRRERKDAAAKAAASAAAAAAAASVASSATADSASSSAAAATVANSDSGLVSISFGARSNDNPARAPQNLKPTRIDESEHSRPLPLPQESTGGRDFVSHGDFMGKPQELPEAKAKANRGPSGFEDEMAPGAKGSTVGVAEAIPGEKVDSLSNAAAAVKNVSSFSPQKSSAAPTSGAPAPEALPKHALQVALVWGRVSAEADKFLADPSMKRPRLLLKKRINRAVNQIAASVKSVCIKIGDLIGALGEAAQSGIPAALSFTMKEIAERLVAEGAGSVALSRPAAFAVGHVIVGVVAHSPDPASMRCVVLGAFYNKCSYVVPTYVRRYKDETESSFRSRLNYLADETSEAYVERMCGYVTLYAAIVQTVDVHGPSGLRSGVRNPFTPEEAWGWLARIVNGPQRSITPDIVHAFLEIAGYELSRLFGSNFASLLASLQTVVVRHASKDARPGAKSRIDGYIDDYVRAGHRVPKPPAGKVLPVSDAENQA